MANIVVEMTGDEARLWRAQQKIIQQQQKIESGYSKAAKEARGLEKAGKAVWDSTRTPMERHQQKMVELNRLYKAGAIDQDTLRRAIGRSVDGMRQAEHVGRRAFGSGALSEVRALAAGFLGVGAAVGGAMAMLRDMRQMAREAANELTQSRLGMSSLAQLANTPEQMQRLVGAARTTFAEGGAPDLDAAARLVFSLESAGALGERQLFSQLRSQGLVEAPDVMARAAKTMIASMGEQETGGFRAMVSKAFGASAFSPASAEALLQAASRAGGSASSLGLSDEEILAATAQLATATGTAEQGATQLASLLRSVDQSGKFRGMNLQQIVGAIGQKNLSSEQLQKLLGREEAVQAFRTLQLNSGEFGGILSAVQQSQAQDLVGVKLGLPAGIPELAAAQQAQQAAARRSLGADRLGRMSLLMDAVQAEQERQMRAGGYSELGLTATRWSTGAQRLVNGDESMLRSLDQQQLRGVSLPTDLLQQIRQELQAINRNTADAAGRVRPTPAERLSQE